MREGKIVVSSHPNRLWVYEEFFYEFAFLRKDLNSVVGSIANIDQSIVCNVDAMNGIPEQLAGRSAGNIGSAVVLVIRRVAIGAPHSFEGSRLGVVHDDPPVEVT